MKNCNFLIGLMVGIFLPVASQFSMQWYQLILKEREEQRYPALIMGSIGNGTTIEICKNKPIIFCKVLNQYYTMQWENGTWNWEPTGTLNQDKICRRIK